MNEFTKKVIPMKPALTHDHFTIKPQGLSFGGKFRACAPQGQPVLFVEQKTKWSAPFNTIHVYSWEKKKSVVLGHPLLVDFSKDPGKLDRCLAITVAFIVAAH